MNKYQYKVTIILNSYSENITIEGESPDDAERFFSKNFHNIWEDYFKDKISSELTMGIVFLEKNESDNDSNTTYPLFTKEDFE